MIRRQVLVTYSLTRKYGAPFSAVSSLQAVTLHRSASTSFSSEAEAAVATKDPPASFKYPKAEELFKKITQQLSGDEVKLMNRHVLDLLGKPIRENEFKIRGIGGKKFKQAAGAGGGADQADDDDGPKPSEVAKTTFDVTLTGFDPASKIKVIKEVRAIADLGLKEAKELVESAPKVIKKDLKREQAEELKKKLEEVGGQVNIV